MTTKLQVIVRDDRLPLVMAMTPGQSGDAPWGRHLLEQLGPQTRSPATRRRPRPLFKPGAGDEGRPSRNHARTLGWELVAPPHPNRHAARPRPLDRAAYWVGNLAERFFNQLKRFRGVAARHHKLDVVYLHMIYLACIHVMTK